MLDWAGAITVLFIWLTWGWAATKLLQGFVFGAERMESDTDIGHVSTLAFAGMLGVFIAVGLYSTGGGL